MARPDLTDALRGGLLGVAVGEALGLPWAGRPPREIKRDRLTDDVGPTGAITAAVLEAAATVGLSPSGLPAALALGWREPDALARRASALHFGFAPVLVADLAAWALAGRPLYHLVADHADDWPPPFRGVAADDRAVVDALLAVLHRHDDPSEGMRAAVRLGGGGAASLTALVGGILGCRRPTAIARVPWLGRTVVPDDDTLEQAVSALAAHRRP
ncbi:MAG TPA: ADP-ribosylglycohydrolase family protein [Baekduia sp.]|uniref:ADP-ribosylglycohydrolase family protein n=1 Tax=Baekduia sp. TaxID=2600305 RepID=UPI002B89870D|nr:ADP-ribosylglycohydrolase family protein [Baekduia sp.]HMJ36022.1 ADP-ribosylglycohydrolase family protein [Baekduia sp.]